MYFQLLLLVTLHYGCVVTGRNIMRRCIVLLVFPAIIGYASSGDDLLSGERASRTTAHGGWVSPSIL